LLWVFDLEKLKFACLLDLQILMNFLERGQILHRGEESLIEKEEEREEGEEEPSGSPRSDEGPHHPDDAPGDREACSGHGKYVISAS
jgi:hypothetical protein